MQSRFDLIKYQLPYFKRLLLPLLARSPTLLITDFSQVSSIPERNLLFATVIPIYKNCVKADFANYCSISILPFMSKIFEKAVNYHLVKFLEHNLILTKSQRGFSSSHNVSTAFTITIDYITRMLDKGEFSLATFLNISKVFDSIDLKILLSKLFYYGIRGISLS